LVWLGTGGFHVGIFLPDNSPVTTGLQPTWIKMSGSAPSWRFRVPRPDPRRRVSLEEDLEQEMPLVARAGPAPDPGGDSAASAGARGRTAVSRAEPVVEEAMNRPFGHEKKILGTLSGKAVRGRWIRGDAVGQARHEVLLGIRKSE
jgi:hypothetical protein